MLATLTLEGTSVADAIYDAWRARTIQFLQFKIDGETIGTGAVAQNLTIGICGYWESVTPIAEQDQGNNLHQALFRGTYDPTGAQILTLTCTTDVSAI